MAQIHEAIASIMKQGYAIGKNRTSDKQKYKFRGIDDVMNTFQPILAEAGIFVVPEVIEAHREERRSNSGGNLIYSVLKIKYTFYAADGSSVSATVIGEGMDSGDKASNKAMAVAMKYAMFQVFCIPTEEMRDDDPDATTPPPSEPAPPKFVCECCGSVIEDYTDPAGKRVSAQRLAERSKQEYGKIYCLDCINRNKE